MLSLLTKKQFNMLHIISGLVVFQLLLKSEYTFAGVAYLLCVVVCSITERLRKNRMKPKPGGTKSEITRT